MSKTRVLVLVVLVVVVLVGIVVIWRMGPYLQIPLRSLLALLFLGPKTTLQPPSCPADYTQCDDVCCGPAETCDSTLWGFKFCDRRSCPSGQKLCSASGRSACCPDSSVCDTDTVGTWPFKMNVAVCGPPRSERGVLYTNNSVCNDGVDNDGDGFIDLVDLGCESEEDASENEATGCRNDFSAINDEVVMDPYFACDNYIETANGQTINRQPGQDGIPDYWGVYWPGHPNNWYVSSPTTHEKKWISDSGIPSIGKKAVLYHYTSFPFTHEQRKDGIAQMVETGFQTERWYKFECTYQTSNILPIFLPNGQLDETLWGSSTEIGCEMRIYHPRANYEFVMRSILVNGPQGNTWDESAGVYTSWSAGSTGGWITRQRYIFIPKGTTKLFFHAKNYGLAELKVAKMSLTPVSSNSDPRIPPFKKQGSLAFATNETGADFFAVGLWGPPSHSGQTASLQEIKDAGINLIVKLGGCHLFDCIHYPYWLNLDQMNALGLYGMEAVYGAGYRGVGGIFNSPIVPPEIKNRVSSLQERVVHSNFLGVYDDEPDCHGEGFLPELREWNWYKTKLQQLFQSNNRQMQPLITIGYCGWRGANTSDDPNESLPWARLANGSVFTQNFPDYSTSAVEYYRLHEIGALMRYRLQQAEQAQGSPQFGWALPSGWYNYVYGREPEWLENDRISMRLLRFQVYNQIVNGATGVLWFGTLDVDLDNSVHRTYFRDMNSINQELQLLMPALLQKDFFDQWSANPSIEAMLKKRGNKAYLFATNPTQESRTFAITLDPALRAQAVAALFEDAQGNYSFPSSRSISLNGTQFSDSFAGFGTHVYEITLSGS